MLRVTFSKLRLLQNLMTALYEDAPLNENGDAHVSWHCAGIRTSTARTMLNLKSFIIFSVDLLSRGGVLKCHGCHRRLYYLFKTLTFMVQHFGMVDTTSAPFILTMAGFCMMALGNIHKKALELSSLQDPLQNCQDIH